PPPAEAYLLSLHDALPILGDLAVVVAAGTPHRDEAFRACREVIEAVKHTSPIWKQEHYADGDSAWSEGCSLCDAGAGAAHSEQRSEEHTSELQSRENLVCR